MQSIIIFVAKVISFTLKNSLLRCCSSFQLLFICLLKIGEATSFSTQVSILTEYFIRQLISGVKYGYGRSWVCKLIHETVFALKHFLSFFIGIREICMIIFTETLFNSYQRVFNTSQRNILLLLSTVERYCISYLHTISKYALWGNIFINIFPCLFKVYLFLKRM